MLKGKRDYIKYAIVSDKKDPLEKFVELYGDYIVKCKYLNFKYSIYYSDFYGKWLLIFAMRTVDLKKIVNKLNLTKYKHTRKGLSMYYMGD